ncbi:MAG: MATE family efflux transporter [Pseudomonadota bacterium]
MTVPRANFIYFQKCRALLLFAAPLIIALLSQAGINFSDVIMLGRLGAHQLAGGALAINIFLFVTVAYIGLCSSIFVRVSSLGSQEKHQEIGSVVRKGVIIITFLSVVGFAVLFSFTTLLAYLGFTFMDIQETNEYLRMLSIGFLPMLWSLILKDFICGVNKLRVIIIVSLFAIPVNVIMNYLLAYGLFGFPKMGLYGIALSTSLVNIGVCFLYICIIFFQKAYRKFEIFNLSPRQFFADEASLLKRFRDIGVPSSISMSLELGLFTVSAIFMGMIGNIALAANQIVFQCVDIGFMIVMGISQATTFYVSQYVANKNYLEAKSYAFHGMFLGAVTSSMMAFLFIFFHKLLISIFIGDTTTHDVSTRLVAGSIFVVAAFSQIQDGVQNIVNGALRGLDDTKIPMYLLIIAYWVIGVPVIYLITFELKFGSEGVWGGIIIATTLCAIFCVRRFNWLINQRIRKSRTDVKKELVFIS